MRAAIIPTAFLAASSAFMPPISQSNIHSNALTSRPGISSGSPLAKVAHLDAPRSIGALNQFPAFEDAKWSEYSGPSTDDHLNPPVVSESFRDINGPFRGVGGGSIDNSRNSKPKHYGFFGPARKRPMEIVDDTIDTTAVEYDENAPPPAPPPRAPVAVKNSRKNLAFIQEPLNAAKVAAIKLANSVIHSSPLPGITVPSLIQEALKNEADAMITDIDRAIPVVYSNAHPKFLEMVLYMPNNLLQPFLYVLHFDRGLRFIARALREAVVMALQGIFEKVRDSSLVDDITHLLSESRTVPPYFGDRTAFIVENHAKYVKQFAKPGGSLDQGLDDFASKVSLVAATGVEKFFALLSESMHERYSKELARISNQSSESSPAPLKMRLEQFSLASRRIIAMARLALGLVSVDVFGAFVKGLAIAFSGLAKHSIRLFLSSPGIRRLMLVTYERIQFMTYVHKFKISHLPNATYEENKEYTVDNILIGHETPEERREKFFKFKAKVQGEEALRESYFAEIQKQASRKRKRSS